MILKLGMQHQGHKLNKVYMNVDLLNGKVTLGRLYVWMGKTVKMSFKEKICSKRLNELNNCVYEKQKKNPRELSAHTLGLNTCIWPLYSNIFFSETAWPIIARFHVEPPWEGGKKFYITGSGHMTKMVVMPIYGKNLQKSSPTDLIVLCS